MNFVIIPAGGDGMRMGVPVPKQFMDVCGKPLIVHTLLKFNSHREIDKITVGCKAEFADFLRKLAESFGIDKLTDIVPGGLSRQETVFNCVSALRAASCDTVMIHDAARPLVTDEIISANIKLAREYGAVSTVIPISDTLARSQDKISICAVPPRHEFFSVQTPQTFKYEIIKNAHDHAVLNGVKDATDDCALCLSDGVAVYMAEGSDMNFKITTQKDALLFEVLISRSSLFRNIT